LRTINAIVNNPTNPIPPDEELDTSLLIYSFLLSEVDSLG
jgi:hypothetical protein